MLRQPQGLREEDVQVVCDVQFDRVEGDKRSTADIEDVWATRLANNPKLFNGTKFRFDSTVASERQPTINLGLTDYKSFLGTNLVESWASLRDSAGKGSHLASPLGNGAVVKSANQTCSLMDRLRLQMGKLF